MGQKLTTVSFSAKNLTAQVSLGTYTFARDAVVLPTLLLTGLNGAAANITTTFRRKTGAGVKRGDVVVSTDAKPTAADTVYWCPVNAMGFDSGDILEVLCLSTNGSDTAAAGSIGLWDAQSAYECSNAAVSGYASGQDPATLILAAALTSGTVRSNLDLIAPAETNTENIYDLVTDTFNAVSGLPSAANNAAAVWNYPTSAAATAGSFGKKLKDLVLGSDNKAVLSADAQPAMTLTTSERTSIAAAVEAALLNEGDGAAVQQALVDKIAAANPSLSGLTLAAIAQTVWNYLVANATTANSMGKRVVDNLNAPISALGSPVQASSYVAPDNTGIANAAAGVLAIKGAGFTPGTDDLHAVRAALAAAGGTAGSGADRCTQTLTNSGTGLAIADADVWVTSDPAGNSVVAGTKQTNSQGKVTFLLDAGSTYYLWMEKDGQNPILGQSFAAVAD